MIVEFRNQRKEFLQIVFHQIAVNIMNWARVIFTRDRVWSKDETIRIHVTVPVKRKTRAECSG
jgi:hypothetical protein